MELLRNAELEAAIEASPDDPGPYLVYADWLQLRNDPRGELIVMQHGNELARAARLIEQHATLLCGDALHFNDRRLTWRWGFLETATLDYHELHKLLEHPSGRFLRELVLRGGVDTAGRELAVRALERHELPVLRKLVLGEAGSAWRPLLGLGDVPALYRAVCNLESLTLVDVIFDGIELRRLRELIVSAQRANVLSTIYAARLPALERLKLQLQGHKTEKMPPMDREVRPA